MKRQETGGNCIMNPSILNMTKSRSMRLAENVERMGMGLHIGY
jgi:hypothetical protein